MRRSRSSRSSSAAAAICRSSRDDSRRKRSIARLRAVVMIHPAGLGGTPLCGHRSSAAAKASCTASSALSMSPHTRTSTDTARPYSSRKTRSISDDGEHRSRRRSAVASPWNGRTSIGSRRRARVAQPPLERVVEVGRLDDREAAEVLLALDERAVGEQRRRRPSARTTVAVLGGCSPPANTQLPAASSSRLIAQISRITGSSTSGGGGGPSGW